MGVRRPGIGPHSWSGWLNARLPSHSRRPRAFPHDVRWDPARTGTGRTGGERMFRLIATRGLPASGKTTFARTLQPPWSGSTGTTCAGCCTASGSSPSGPRGRSRSSSGPRWRRCCGPGSTSAWTTPTCASRTLRDWAELAARFGAAFEVHDFTDVPLEECLRRDAARPEADRVGEAAIRRLHERYLAEPAAAAAGADGPYRARRPRCTRPPRAAGDRAGRHRRHGRAERLPQPVRHDPGRRGRAEPGGDRGGPGDARGRLRGRLLLRPGRLGPGRHRGAGWTGTSGCPTWRCTCARSATPARTSSSSGRSTSGRSGDRYRVVGVFDDRLQVVRMWRALGLTVFQVAEGDF